MVGHICDCLVLPTAAALSAHANTGASASLRYYKDVPVAYALRELIPTDRAALLVTFECVFCFFSYQGRHMLLS